MPERSPLPIDECLPQIAAALEDRHALVLQAPPGAGKTTRVPPALASAGWSAQGRIIVLEPRRMAARAAARRIAAECGATLGREVGYQVRFDDRSSRETRILIVTEGIFLRHVQSDPFLEGVAAVVFDEFHERSLIGDLALAMARRVQQVRTDLRLVLMSATLDPAPLAAALGDCPVVRSEGRQFPVDVRYVPRAPRAPLPEAVADAIERALGTTDGDMLVFLPGVGEIHRTAALLQSAARRDDLALMLLYGDLPPDEQDRVLAPSPRRKVVLSTNVAETSLTIEGVRVVIDSGLARMLRFDPESGLDRLELTPISRASAEQRTGRAGRTAPGVCWRLWDEASQRARPEREAPEIARVDLSGAVLTLRSWGEQDPAAVPWIEAPAADRLDRADRLLSRLEAIDEAQQVTPLGRTLARLPTQPRLARLVVEGHRAGQLQRTCLLAAWLAERSPFSTRRDGPPPGERSTRSHSDVLDRLNAIEQFLRTGDARTPWGELHRGGVHTIRQGAEQLLQTAEAELGPAPRFSVAEDEPLLRALLAAFPDRVARRREPGSDRAVLVGGRGVKLAPGSAVTSAELFLAIDVADAQPEAIVRLASAIERDWLPEHFRRDVVERFFHPSQKQVVARRRVYWEDLLLSEAPVPTPDDDATAEALFAAARSQWSSVFPADAEEASFLERVEFLRQRMPELELPDFDEPQRMRLLRELCAGRRSFAELRSAPWLHAVKGLLTYDQLRAIDREAPERVTAPSGKSFRLTYESGRPPVLAARIQDLFGLRETPRIAGGRAKVLVHLLAPNMRPQQVTDDLPSFWATTYAEVRKELRRRYPKHAWPENPLQ
ncbi:MAG: ATP-dependent helicase HrpB [Planctomyces sp.]|nr:ATP-dependent helicase HrpB [Planctomyces sp.]